MQLFKTRKPLLGPFCQFLSWEHIRCGDLTPFAWLKTPLGMRNSPISSRPNQSIKGHRNLSAFVIDTQSVHYAGIGFDENSEVEIGSITKTMTAEVLRKQVERGEIRLDTTVGEVLSFSDSPVASVTVEELARHTSGLPPVALTPRFFLARVTNSDHIRDSHRRTLSAMQRRRNSKGAVNIPIPISVSLYWVQFYPKIQAWTMPI